MKEVKLKVWHPDKGTYRVLSIASDRDHIGNLVAEGHIPQEHYWDELVSLKNGRIKHLSQMKMELEEEVRLLTSKLAGLSK